MNFAKAFNWLAFIKEIVALLLTFARTHSEERKENKEQNNGGDTEPPTITPTA